MNFNKFIIVIITSFFLFFEIYSQKIKPLKIGEKAPYFELPGVDGKVYSLNDFNQSDILVIIFMSNYCPTSQAYEDKIIKMANDFSNISINFVAISPNKPEAILFEDQGYSDISDDFEEMKMRAKDKAFNFPYLYDGDKQEVSKAYGPQATPHVFIFDKKRILRYHGRFDNIENPYREPTQRDARSAILALFTNIEVIEKTTKTFGCPVKWDEDTIWKNKTDEDWNKKKVKLELIQIDKLEKLRNNFNDNILLLYIWANIDSSVDNDLQNIVKIHRIYNQRFFEVNSLAIKKSNFDSTLKLLKNNNAAIKNYIYTDEIDNEFILAIDNDWDGDTPYGLIIAPEGEIIYKWKGQVDILKIRKIIINEIGRYYAND